MEWLQLFFQFKEISRKRKNGIEKVRKSVIKNAKFKGKTQIDLTISSVLLYRPSIKKINFTLPIHIPILFKNLITSSIKSSITTSK